MTLIVLEDKIVQLKGLDKYKLQQVLKINIFPKEDKMAKTIYGLSAQNGLIFIELKPIQKIRKIERN